MMARGGKRMLVACELSGVVRNAFSRRGWDAWSCDLLPSEWAGQHIVGDAIDVIRGGGWDIVVAHPPCTHLCRSGAWDWSRKRLSGELWEGIKFFKEVVWALEETGVKKWCIENPIGIMGRIWRRADQIIQPYEFGHDASKATCLWLRGLPRLMGTRRVPGIWVDGRERWANQTDSGQSRLGSNSDRSRLRSRTYSGIAEAMADQWG